MLQKLLRALIPIFRIAKNKIAVNSDIFLKQIQIKTKQKTKKRSIQTLPLLGYPFYPFSPFFPFSKTILFIFIFSLQVSYIIRCFFEKRSILIDIHRILTRFFSLFLTVFDRFKGPF